MEIKIVHRVIGQLLERDVFLRRDRLKAKNVGFEFYE